MKEVFLLTKILFKSSFTQNSKKNNILKYLGYGLVYLYIAAIVGYVSFEAISALKLISQEAVFLNLCFVSVLSFIIIREIFTSINVLFFSKDIEFLLPLPIKPYKIIMAKLNYLIIAEYFICAVILLPALLVYGVLMQMNLWFYILSIIIFFMFPVIPVVIVSLIMTLIMKFTNLIRNKDFVQYVTVAISLIIILGVQFLTTVDSEITQTEMAEMLVKANGLVEIYTEYFITLKPIMNSILNYNSIYGLGQLCVFIVQTVIMYAFVVKIASSFYIKTITNSISIKSKKKNEKSNEKVFKGVSTKKSYVAKEWKNLIRNPIYFMQCIMPSILFPLIMIFPIYVTIRDSASSEMAELTEITFQNINSAFGIGICIGIAIFCFMFNFVSITAISREGRQAVFMKYIPLGLKEQCLYKIMPGIILNLFPIIYILIALKLLIPDTSIVFLLELAVILMILNILNNYIMIIIDLKRPKLEWLTEYAVVKQNFNMVYEMTLYLLEIIVIGFLGAFIQSKEFFVLLILLICIILIGQVKKYLVKNETKLFNKIA